MIPCTEHLPTISAVMTSLNEFELDSAARAKVGKFIPDPVISHATYRYDRIKYRYERVYEIKLHMRHFKAEADFKAELNFQPFWVFFPTISAQGERDRLHALALEIIASRVQ